MDVVLSKFQHVHASYLFQELKDSYAVGRVHVALEKLPADSHHLLELQHIRRHHQLLNVVHSHADRAWPRQVSNSIKVVHCQWNHDQNDDADRSEADLCIWSPAAPRRPQSPPRESAPPPDPPHSFPPRTVQRSMGCWQRGPGGGLWRPCPRPLTARRRSRSGVAFCWSGPGWVWRSGPRPTEAGPAPGWPWQHHRRSKMVTQRQRTWQ